MRNLGHVLLYEGDEWQTRAAFCESLKLSSCASHINNFYNKQYLSVIATTKL